MDVAQKHQDQLDRIKLNIRNAYEYNEPNYRRFNDFKRFVYDSSLGEAEIALLNSLGRPTLEFNVLPAYVSRLLGEFYKQEPDIEVSADDETQADPAVINLVEQHLRHVFTASCEDVRYQLYKDVLNGYGVLKVVTDYAAKTGPLAFQQIIKFELSHDPTLCGFDPMARETHKGDGEFCFEIYPLTEDELKEQVPNVDLSTINYASKIGVFNFSFMNEKKKILLLCNYYEKKKKRVKIVQLRTGEVMTKSDYEEKLASWTDITQQPPIAIGERWTEIETICRYQLIDNKVLKYEETDFSHFPLIYVDGNSEYIQTADNTNFREIIRPYLFHAKDTQRLKNFAGIALANHIENIVQHKFIIKKEALPTEQPYLDAIIDVQKPSNIVVNAFYQKNPDMPIPEPIIPIQPTAAPPEITQAFSGADSTIQTILGSFDSALGINDNQLSGRAIEMGALHSNATSMPYIQGFMAGLERAAVMYVDLMPKYCATPRTLPIIDKEGRRSYVKVNGQGQPSLKYNANVLNVKVKAGASFSVQKSHTINMVKEMMGMSQYFAQFISEKGLNFVLDNIEAKGVDQLKQSVDEWMQEMQQQKQMAMQQQQQEMQNNPVVMRNKIEMAKLQQNAQKSQADFQLDMMKLKQAEEKVLADIQVSKANNATQVLKANTEKFAKEIDFVLKHNEQTHKHDKEVAEFHQKERHHHDQLKHQEAKHDTA